jgi:hypothetical protein
MLAGRRRGSVYVSQPGCIPIVVQLNADLAAAQAVSAIAHRGRTTVAPSHAVLVRRQRQPGVVRKGSDKCVGAETEKALLSHASAVQCF